MIVELYYPLSKPKLLEFKPNVIGLEFRSVKNEQWIRCQIISSDTSQFSKVMLVLLVRELNRLQSDKHHLSKCTKLEELLCQLN